MSRNSGRRGRGRRTTLRAPKFITGNATGPATYSENETAAVRAATRARRKRQPQPKFPVEGAAARVRADRPQRRHGGRLADGGEVQAARGEATGKRRTRSFSDLYSEFMGPREAQ